MNGLFQDILQLVCILSTKECISLELGLYQVVTVILGIEEHTCTEHSLYQF